MEEGQGSSSGTRKKVLLKCNQKRDTGGALIGRLEVAKELNRGTVMTMIQKGWNLNGEIEVLDIEKNVFVFQFSDRDDYLRVLRGRPWAIQSFLLNLQLWDDEMLYKEVSFNKCPFWVRFHGLPFMFVNQENAVRLGSSVGEVVMVEDPIKNGKMIRNFLRARVLLNIHEPLVTGLWVPRNEKEDAWTEVKYERLPTICYRCGIIGHEQRNCRSTKTANNEDDSDFGSWLKASPPRFIEDLVRTVDEHWYERPAVPLKSARDTNLRLERGFDIPVQRHGRAAPQGENDGNDRDKTTSHKMTNTRGKAQDECDSRIHGKQNGRDPHLVKSKSDGLGLGLSTKAQNVLAIGSPMKHFYRLSPGSKEKANQEAEPKQDGPNVKVAGGRSGLIVNLSAETHEPSTAIIPYIPNSPISKVVESLGTIKLKRTPPEITSPQQCKRSKKNQIGIDKNNKVDEGTYCAGEETRKLPKKRNVRRTKQHLRRKLAFPSNSSPGSTLGSGVNVTMGIPEQDPSLNNAEGVSGWPHTALPAP